MDVKTNSVDRITGLLKLLHISCRAVAKKDPRSSNLGLTLTISHF